ncbi:MAG TPA: hypothetical protein VE052_09855 [Gemmatimonadaceae bacterium]|nr:hypothetical protein [Gemmatimonadaceae bacterium]
MCYGASSSSPGSNRVGGGLHDLLADATTDSNVVRLPIDSRQIIDNLRYERYARNGLGTRTQLTERHHAFHQIYYRLRGFLPVAIRKHLQRLALRNWRNIPFPGWPVDGTVERILERLLVLSMKAQGLHRIPFIWFWPDGAAGCAIMTHDVETRPGRDFCSHLMDLDNSAGIRSSFQIVPEERYTVSDSFLAEIRSRGFEINIHDLNHDGRLFASYDEFLRRARRINDHGKRYGAVGFRSGGLYRNPAWFSALEFSYDMSIPSTAHLDPQRGGCCSLMPFFIDDVLELPLTTMQDYSLFNVLNDYSIDIWTEQLSAITARNGLATFLVHPDYIRTQRAQKTYRALLEHLARMRDEAKLWLPLPGEVDQWWRQRRHLTIVGEDGAYSIQGQGKERARLAFATLAGDTLTFDIAEQN